MDIQNMPLTDKEKKIITDFFELIFSKIENKGSASPKAFADITKDKVLKEEKEKGRLIPLVHWNDYHDYPTVSQLRWMRFTSYQTGFDKCLRKIGRRLYIVEDEFFEWFKSQQRG